MRSCLPCLLALTLATPAVAAWDPDPSVNVPVTTAPGEAEDSFVVSDGAGGAIVVFEEERGADLDLYAQRLDVNGDPMWDPDGVLVCGAPGDQHVYRSSTGTTGFTPVLPDGEGGVWIAWHDGRAFGARQNDIFLQRLDADGNAHFDVNGLPIATGTGMEDQPTLGLDGTGGVVVVWQDRNADPVFYDLHGQRISAGGDLLWNGGNPRPLVVVGWDQDAPVLVPDGSGGVFMAWTDSRDNLNDVYAQRLSPDGDDLWAASGVPVAQSANGQDAITMIPSEDGHPILAWVDRRLGSPDIYAQKLDAADGSGMWGFGGTAVCLAADSQYRPALATDGAGGAFVAWFDYRNAPSGPPWELDIFVQRMLVDGSPAWTPDGIAACAAADAQRDADLWPDGVGGVFVAWEDNRIGTGREDVYAQHLDGAGTPTFEADGRAISTVDGNQQRPDLVAGAGGAILAWRDDRDELFVPDVYADRLLLAEGGVIGVNRVRVDLSDAGGDSRVVTVSNVGAAAFDLLDVTLADGGQGFDLSLSGSVPVELLPGDAIEVTVSFDPGLVGGAAEDLLLVVHDAPEVASGVGVGSPVEVPLRAGAITVGVGDASPSTPSVAPLSVRPAPFTGSTRIGAVLKVAGEVTLSVHDVAGRRMRTLVDGWVAAGAHRWTWDGRDAADRTVPPGLYVIRLESPEGTRTTKVVRLGGAPRR